MSAFLITVFTHNFPSHNVPLEECNTATHFRDTLGIALETFDLLYDKYNQVGKLRSVIITEVGLNENGVISTWCIKQAHGTFKDIRVLNK